MLLEITFTQIVVVGIIGGILFFAFIISMFNKFLVKASPGQALVKTGFGLDQPKISLSSAFVIPLFNKVESIDLTVKTVKIERKAHDSLSCADGIRAEVEVDFYIQINPVDPDIRQVATTIGCERASHSQTLRELFEAKFADALKTAGSKLTFDQLYQNRAMFRDEILKSLGQEGKMEVVLNGYRLDDVAIQYMEQLPLTKHNEDNVLDAKGRKEIAQRTSAEAEFANKRLRLKEITIQEQNQEARTKDLQIKQDIAEKEAKQEREIKEIQSREITQAQKTMAEQERVAAESLIAKEKSIKIAEEKKLQEITTQQIEREKIVQVADQQKQQDIEIAKIQRETREAEAMKQKLIMLEETAKQEAQKIKAEEQAITVKAMEVADRNKRIEIINAEKAAAVETQKRNVESDVMAYQLITVAKAKLDAADLDAQAAQKQTKTIVEVGKAEAEALKMKLEAENLIGERVMISNALSQIIPLLPTLVEKLMLPAEKIESIKVLNITGMEHLGGNGGNGEGGSGVQNNNPTASIINTLLSAGMMYPVLKEIMKLIGKNDEISNTLTQLPGGEALIKYLNEQKLQVPKK